MKTFLKPGLLLLAAAAAPFARAAGSGTDTLRDALALAARTLAYVEKSVAVPGGAAKLADFTAREKAAADKPARDALEREVRAFRRATLFAHPDLGFKDILANQRLPPYGAETHMCDQCVGRFALPAPGLVVIEDWKSAAPRKREILKGKLPAGCAWNPDLHWDGDRVLFAFCDYTDRRTELQKRTDCPPTQMGPYSPDDPFGRAIARCMPEHPFLKAKKGDRHRFETSLRYFLYECAVDGSWVRQITGTPRDEMRTLDGRQCVLIEDIDPCYLPDGGIAFCSTRSQNFGRCHNGRYTPSFLLFRADADGSNIRQLSWGEANEFEPCVLNDGRIGYTRWDYIDRNAAFFHSLWVINPDGTKTAHLYGNYTTNPRGKSECKAVPGSHLILATATAHHFQTAGVPILIDLRKGEDGLDPVTSVTPELPFPEIHPCAQNEFKGALVWGDKGYYANPHPINDTLFLASYSPDSYHFGDASKCSVPWAAAWPQTNSFSIYLIDTLGGREPIFADPACNTLSPIPVRKTPRPPVLASSLDPAAPAWGVCTVENVYNCRRELPKGSVKALRVNRIHNQLVPVRPDAAGGYPLVKEPLGTVPVAADGSAAFRLPAEVPLQLQALDADGVAVFTMRSFIYLQKGERLSCVGCHESKAQSGLAGTYASTAALKSTPHEIAPYDAETRKVSFCRNAKPVLDRHCIRCHGLGEKPAKGLDLLGRNVARHDAAAFDFGNGFPAYWTLVKERIIARARPYKETAESFPRDYFAAASKLTALVRAGHKGVDVPKAEFDALALWLDLNAQMLSSYSWNAPELGETNPAALAELRAAVRARFGEALARAPFYALVNPGCPEKSRVLMAPLPVKDGGWGQIADGYTGRDDPDFIRMSSLVARAYLVPATRDVAGTCGQSPCKCGSCWIWRGAFNTPAP